MIVFKILQQVLTSHFYQKNAGLLLFAFFILFGLPSTPVYFHLAMIEGIIESQVFLGFVFVLWLIYTIKCVDYLLKQMAAPSQNFLFVLSNLTSRQVLVYMLFVQLVTYLPVLLYAIAIIVIAVQKNYYVVAFEIVVFNLVVITTSSLLYRRFITKTDIIKLPFRFPRIHYNFPKPFFLYPVIHLLNNRKQMLLFSKAFSLLILYVFIYSNEPDHYDVRPLQLCFLLVVIAQTTVIFEIREFEINYLAFAKNLPLNIVTRFTHLVLIYFMLMLPEFIMLTKGIGPQIDAIDYPGFILLAVSLLLFFHVTLLVDHPNIEQYLQRLFAIGAVSFFVILYNPGIYFALAALLLAFALFSSYYYSSESKEQS